MNFLKTCIVIITSFLVIHITSSSVLAQSSLKTPVPGKQYFTNYVYGEIWGYSWYSLNYLHFFQKPNLLMGGGFAATPESRTFTLEGGGGIVHLFIVKQIMMTQKFHYGFGVGVSHDFGGPYDYFLDPIYLQLAINRVSISHGEDRLYYGLSIYYKKWESWAVRPGIRIGISF